MKFPIICGHLLSSLCSFALLSMTISADTYVMKDGKEFKGNIIKETNTHYILKVETAKSIHSEEKILISDVKKVIREDLSKSEAKRLKALVPIPDFTKISEYDRIIYKEYTPFLRKNKISVYYKEIKKISDDLKEERRIINDGGYKIDGVVKKKEEVDYNRYEITASADLHAFNRLVKRRMYVSAMRRFESLEVKYKNTKPFIAAVSIASKMLPKFKRAVLRLEGTVEKEIAIRDKALARMTDSERNRTQKLLDQEANAYLTKLKHAEEGLKSKWLPLNKYHMEPIKKVLANIEKEQQRLEAYNKEELTDAGKVYRQVVLLIESKDPERAKEKLEEFSKLNTPEEFTLALQVQLHKIMSDVAEQREKEAAAAKKKEEQETKERQEERNKERNNDKKKKNLMEKLKEKKEFIEKPL